MFSDFRIFGLLLIDFYTDPIESDQKVYLKSYHDYIIGATVLNSAKDLANCGILYLWKVLCEFIFVIFRVFLQNLLIENWEFE